MKEELISFETAELASEKGFDWICRFYYIYILDKRPFEPFEPGNYNDYGDSLEKISAPTQSLLQKWLREKHNMQLVIDHGINGYFCHFTKRKIGELNDYKFWVNDQNNPCKTYEQALELGLQDALKLID